MFLIQYNHQAFVVSVDCVLLLNIIANVLDLDHRSRFVLNVPQTGGVTGALMVSKFSP